MMDGSSVSGRVYMTGGDGGGCWFSVVAVVRRGCDGGGGGSAYQHRSLSREPIGSCDWVELQDVELVNRRWFSVAVDDGVIWFHARWRLGLGLGLIETGWCFVAMKAGFCCGKNGVYGGWLGDGWSMVCGGCGDTFEVFVVVNRC